MKDEQILLRKKFDSLRVLFEWLYDETSNESVKEMILELVSMKKWVKDSKFEFTEKVWDAIRTRDELFREGLHI